MYYKKYLKYKQKYLNLIGGVSDQTYPILIPQLETIKQPVMLPDAYKGAKPIMSHYERNMRINGVDTNEINIFVSFTGENMTFNPETNGVGIQLSNYRISINTFESDTLERFHITKFNLITILD